MTFSNGYKRSRRSLPWLTVWGCLLWLALSASVSASEASPKNLEQLLVAYATMPGLEAEYVEEKQLALLAKPLTSRGRIYFMPPGYLVRKTEAPTKGSVVITPTHVRLSDANGSKSVDLRTRKEVRPFVQSLVWLLSGDSKSIRKAYDVAFTRSAESQGWQLSLKPKGEPLSRIVKRMTVKGKGLNVQEIEVLETSGDTTLTRITAANPERRFNPAERARLFGTSVAD